MQGGVAGAIQKYAPFVRHYQCANPPDRSEPGRDVIDYAVLFRQIAATGYTGWIGCEYKPKGLTEDGLGWVQQCGVSLG
jgi:hydroxypyruvate isomerase